MLVCAMLANTLLAQHRYDLVIISFHSWQESIELFPHVFSIVWLKLKCL